MGGAKYCVMSRLLVQASICCVLWIVCQLYFCFDEGMSVTGEDLLDY